MSTNPREYMRAYAKKRYLQRRAWALRLLGGKCVHCGSKSDLQFDHKNPDTKTASIGSIWFTNITRLESELRKCQLLCRPCHNLKTLAESGLKPARGTHGTLSAYKYCRCNKCKAANAKYCSDYRKKNR